jgi:hypothetical protein
MPTVQVITLGPRHEDIVRGTISLGPVGVQIDPPNDPLLSRMIRPFRTSWNNRTIGPENGQEFLMELPHRYKSAYLRAVLIPDPPASEQNAIKSSQTPRDPQWASAPPAPVSTSQT